MGYDGKYGQITAENRVIPDDEPVFLFRAKDVLLPQVLHAYRRFCIEAGSPQEHCTGIEAAIVRVVEWQQAHPTQVPGSGEIPDRKE